MAIIHVHIYTITCMVISPLRPFWRVKIPKHSLLLRVLFISTSPSDGLCRPYHPLESPVVVGSAVSIPSTDTFRQDVLKKLLRVLRAKPNLFSLLRLKRRCCSFFTTLSVWLDHFRSSVMCTQRNLKLFTFSNAVQSMWIRSSILFSTWHSFL